MSNIKNIVTPLIFSAAIITSVIVIGNSYKYKFKSAESISVTGLSEKDFTSDLIVWSGSFERNAYELKDALASWKQDEKAIRSFLISNQIPAADIKFTPPTITRLIERHYDDKGNEISAEFKGYSLSGSVRVESKKVDEVEKMSGEITELIEQGIELNTAAPEYYYTKLNEVKIDLLAKASADAKVRAETIAKNSGAELKEICKANMGVFQITGKNSNEDYSYGGVFNTSSKIKTASITIKVDYRMKN